jgi:recombination protein RecT
MTGAIGTAVAQQEERVNASAAMIVRDNGGSLKATLPSHLHDDAKADAWLRRSAGALRKGKILNDGRYELEAAAQSNPAAFVFALREAAGLGLQPGTEEYYLTARKVNGRPEILGIVGYMGYIELMFRAGAVASVEVDVVRQNDTFHFIRGRDEYPVHGFDWLASDSERGEIVLAYAYAKMITGHTSYVVILNQDKIKDIKKKSQGSGSDYSPWQTDPAGMWKKSAIRQLRKWVPTSAEYRATMIRQAVEGQQANAVTVPEPNLGITPIPDHAQLQIRDPDEVVDAELEETPPAVEQTPEEPPAPQEPAGAAPATMSKAMASKLMKLFGEAGYVGTEEILTFMATQLVEVKQISDATPAQGAALIKALENKIANKTAAG